MYISMSFFNILFGSLGTILVKLYARKKHTICIKFTFVGVLQSKLY